MDTVKDETVRYHTDTFKTIQYFIFHGSVFGFPGSCTVFTIFLSDFQLFQPEYHWRDLSSRNAHLVHQNWYRISFTFLMIFCLMMERKLCMSRCNLTEIRCHIWTKLMLNWYSESEESNVKQIFRMLYFVREHNAIYNNLIYICKGH
jgi:hypothetical protein